MKTQFKVLSVVAAALAVVFSTAGVSMAFSAPGEMANCRAIDGGLSFECDPVSNLAVVNSGVIPVSGISSPSFTTSLRGINDIESAMPATSLRAINENDFGAADLSLNDNAISIPDVDLKLDLPPLDDFYFGGHYGGMPY